jgi:hypothetical protein
VTSDVNVRVNLNGAGQLNRVLKEQALRERWGGAYEHAAVGKLRDAHVAAPAGPARYAYAEPQTGGEAFVPKRGNYGRSMEILSAAAGWYNADVVPRGGYYGSGQASAGGTFDLNVTVQNPEGRVLHKELVRYATDGNRSPASLWSSSRR